MSNFQCRLTRAGCSGLISHEEILVFCVLKTAHEITPLNNKVARRAIVLIAYARAALIVQQVERYVLAFGRGVDSDGDRH
jgi:hypothetical protein